MTEDRYEGERELVRRCLAGEPSGGMPGVSEPSSWEQFVRRYHALLAFAVQKTLKRYGASPDPDAVDDILQDLFLRLFRDRDSVLRRFEWRCSLGTYLTTLAVSRTIDELRRRKASPPEIPKSVSRLRRELSAGSPDPGLPEKVEAALSRLSGQEQAILRLFYWEELPAERIGRLLQLQEGSVRSILTRARDRLRELIAQGPLLLF